MKDFYCIEENFDFLYNDISILLSGIIESTISEGWLEDYYMSNRYNTTKAVEKYGADIIVSKLKNAGLSREKILSLLDNRICNIYESFDKKSLDDKLYMIESVKSMTFKNENVLEYILEDFENIEILKYLRESYLDEKFIPSFKAPNKDLKNILSIIESITFNVRKSVDDDEKLEFIKTCNDRILYKYKSDVQLESSFHTSTSKLYDKLEESLNNQPDEVLEYSLRVINHTNDLIEYVLESRERTNEAMLYQQGVEEFNNLVESIFFDESDNDIDINDFIKLYNLTEALCEYESTMEASSRIITMGTEKVTKGIGNASAKSRGMAASDSKIGQIKRGARIIDDRASSAINNKIDQIINFTQDAKREKIITGKTTVKLGRILKSLITAIAAGKIVKALPKQTLLKIPFTKVALKAPLLGVAATVISLLVSFALSKRTEEREKKRILMELETELRITKEKIEDAKGENAKEQKYQLMRIEAQLDKEIMRIKHGLRYY
jgi:SOS response regulatory protein OraA/RecX